MARYSNIAIARWSNSSREERRNYGEPVKVFSILLSARVRPMSDSDITVILYNVFIIIYFFHTFFCIGNVFYNENNSRDPVPRMLDCAFTKSPYLNCYQPLARTAAVLCARSVAKEIPCKL